MPARESNRGLELYGAAFYKLIALAEVGLAEDGLELDEAALDELITLAEGVARRVAREFTLQPADADDLAQDVLWIVWKKILSPEGLKDFVGRENLVMHFLPPSSKVGLDRDFQRPSSVAWRSYMWRIARNRAIDRLRQYRDVLTDPMPEMLEVEEPSPTSGDVEDLELVRRISDALEQLPAQEAEILRIWFLELEAAYGKFPVVAERMGLSVESARRLLRRAKRHLRNRLVVEP